MLTDKYKIWYRDDSEPDIDDIPEDVKYSNVTLHEFISATEGMTVGETGLRCASGQDEHLPF